MALSAFLAFIPGLLIMLLSALAFFQGGVALSHWHEPIRALPLLVFFLTGGALLHDAKSRLGSILSRVGTILGLFAVLLPIFSMGLFLGRSDAAILSDIALNLGLPALLASLALLTIYEPRARRFRHAAPLFAAGLVGWGMGSLALWMLGLISLYGVFEGWQPLLLMLLGLALGWRMRQADWFRASYADKRYEQINLLSTVIFLFLVLTAAFVSFALLKQQAQQNARKTMAIVRDSRAMLISSEKASAMRIAQEMASRMGLTSLVQAANEGGLSEGGHKALEEIARRALSLRISGFRIYDKTHRILAQQGHVEEDLPPLRGDSVARLQWKKKWMLETNVAIRVQGQQIGSLYTSFPLEVLNGFANSMHELGTTGEMLVCAPEPKLGADCYLSRFQKDGMHVQHLDAATRTVLLAAFQNKTGFAEDRDADGKKWMLAYAPVPGTGLGLVIRMSEAELYAPLYAQVRNVFFLFAILALVGTLLLRRRVLPLLKHLAHSEKTAQQAKTHLYTLIEALPLAVFFKDGQGRWLVVNQYGLSLFKLNGQHWQGKRDLELARECPDLTESFERCAEDDERGWKAGRRYETVEFVPMGPNGVLHEFEVTKIPLFDADGSRKAMVVVGHDVTERKRAEKEIQLLGQYNRNLIEANLDALAVLACDGRIMDVNVAMEKMVGLPRLALLNSSIFDYVDDQARGQHGLALLLEQGVVRDYSMQIRHHTGRMTPVEFNGTVFHDEKGVVAGAFVAAHDVTERKQAEQKMHHLAYYDALTNLPNRILFKDRLQQALRHAKRQQHELAVMFLDLDRFKLINDTLGHGIGDLLLQAMAERLRECVRGSDTIARMGGDEFTVLVSGLQQGQDAAVVARKMLDTVKRPFWLDGHELFVGTSIGIAVYPRDGTDPETLLKHADMAMYSAKEQGNFYRFYTQDLNALTMERLALENALRHAIEAGEFCLVYQPQVDTANGLVKGMEALLRWHHPEQGVIPPLRFIPLAEETGLIVPLGEWMLRQACRQNQAWQEQGLRPVRMAVNISARQFRQPDLVKTVDAILKETGLAPQFLELELAESLVMDQDGTMLEKVQALRAMGITISIDDFGTGYSSLSYLQHFPVDKLKIDRAFVSGITHVLGDAAIAKTIIAMAHSMNLEVAAEGVETQAQMHFLQTNKCCLMQGYYFAHPMASNDLARLLEADVDLRRQAG